MLADQTALDIASGKENGASGTVVGAEGIVFFDAAAEFTEGEDNHAVVELGGLEVVQKGFERAAELAQERSVRVDLRGVGVVAGLRDVVDAGRAAEFEQLGDEAEFFAKFGLRIIIRGGGLVFARFAELSGSVERLGDGSLDEGGDVE